MPIMWLQRQQVEKSGKGSMDQWMHHAGKNTLIPIFSPDVFCSEGRLEAGKEEMEIPGQLKWTNRVRLETSKIAYVIWWVGLFTERNHFKNFHVKNIGWIGI